MARPFRSAPDTSVDVCRTSELDDLDLDLPAASVHDLVTCLALCADQLRHLHLLGADLDPASVQRATRHVLDAEDAIMRELEGRGPAEPRPA